MHARSNILRPGGNVWKIARAGRFAPLVDGAEFFGAVRQSLLRAQKSVVMLGWDFHSRMRLVGESGEAEDGYPAELAPFLSAVIEERPDLHIYLLLWDFAVLYAGEREWLPKWRLDWATPDRLHFRLDRAVPTGASQHQKLVVVDDAVAFAGGLDLTIRRWDTSEHKLNSEHRIDPSGDTYAPFHDVQAVVDSDAARAIGEIARSRWQLVTGEKIAAVKTGSDPWPEAIEPAFADIDVGIARTRPAYGDEQEVREVEQLFIDSIAAAERHIYIENQFLTSTKIAEHLCKALKRKPELEAVFVGPHGAESWIEIHTMRYGRIRFAQTFCDEGVADRIRIFCPVIPNGEDCIYPMIHSKVMVVDDKLLRIGSANLNNRSMGTDAECDLVIEADSATVRQQIAAVRNRLIAEHVRCSVEQIEKVIADTGSLIAAIEQCSGEGAGLRPIDDGKADPSEYDEYLGALADPERPISYESILTMFGVRDRRRFHLTLIVSGVTLAALVSLGLLWYLTPLADFADPQLVRQQFASLGASLWAPLIVVAAFLIAGVLMFPINILIAGAAAAFGPWIGVVYAGIGCLASALLTYAVGRWLGAGFLRDLLGKRLNRVRQRIVKQGIVSVAAIRLVPVAPFTVVNLVAGASEIKFFDYLIGTILGLAPGIVIMSFLGDQAASVFSDPTVTNVLLLAGIAAVWIGVAVAAQMFVSRKWRKAA
jgi:phospholipase D1/2